MDDGTAPMDKGEVTRILKSWEAGDPDALERLFPLVLDELRAIARSYLARESPEQSLQPTELINEVCLKLLRQGETHWENRSQFYAFSAKLMRCILVDSARSRKAVKRSGGIKVSFHDALGLPEEKSPSVLALDEALDALEELSPRQAKVVEMKFFGGWTIEQTAETLGVGTTTVKRDKDFAIAWLRHELSKEEG